MEQQEITFDENLRDTVAPEGTFPYVTEGERTTFWIPKESFYMNPACYIKQEDDAADYARYFVPFNNEKFEAWCTKRANRGVVTDDGNSLIEPEFVKMFFNNPPWTPGMNAVKHVFITVDPNTSNSGTAAEMALVATCQVFGMRVVSSLLPLLFLP
jgi:hypothetical protein